MSSGRYLRVTQHRTRTERIERPVYAHAESPRVATRASREPLPHARTDARSIARLAPLIGNRALQRFVQGTAANVTGNAEFVAQVKQANGSWRNGTGVVLAPGPANTPLRISDDRQMAVEDTNLTNRQPKYFYATDKVVKNSKSALKKGEYSLVIDQRDAIEVAKPNGTRVQLHRIVPKRVKTVTGVTNTTVGTGVTAEGVCDAVARTIIGHDPQLVLPKLKKSISMKKGMNDVEYRTARYFVDRVTNALSSSKSAKKVKDTVDITNMLTITQAYMHVLTTSPAVANQIAKDLGVNQYALANVGQAYGSVSLGQVDTTGIPNSANGGVKVQALVDNPGSHSGKTRNAWGTHYGAVVAASGKDRITLENYGRTHEEGMVIGDDPIYYFQMYGTGAGQSWHEQGSQGASPTINPITMVY